MRTVAAILLPHLPVCAIRNADPKVCGKPLAVVSSGRVMDRDQHAGRLGVFSGMNADHLPAGVMAFPRQPEAEAHLRRQVSQRFLDATPLVEETQRGQWLLELTGTRRVHHNSEVETVAQLLMWVAEKVQLNPIIGVGSSPSVAAVARNSAQLTHLRWLRVMPGQESRFLSHLPVTALPGVGQALAQRLTRLGIVYLEDLLRCPETDLIRAFGPRGRLWRAWSLGIDRTPVRAAPLLADPATIAFSPGLHEQKDNQLRDFIHQGCDQLGCQLRRERRFAARIRLELTEWDEACYRRIIHFDPPQDRTILLAQKIWQELEKLRRRRVMVKRILLTLVESVTSQQLVLFSESELPIPLARHGLDESLDAVRRRFGVKAIGYGMPL